MPTSTTVDISGAQASALAQRIADDLI